jgi:hypothetical protein
MSETQSKWDVINQRYELSKSRRSKFESEWKQSNSYRRGDQWSGAKSFSWQERPVVNYIADAIATRTAALVEEVPAIVAEPRDPAQDVLAQTLTKVVQYVFDVNDMPRLLDRAEDNRVEGGTWIMQVAYDPLMLNGLGDIRVSVIDCVNFYPDPNAYDLDECEWVIVAVPKPIRYIEERYGKKVPADKVIAEDTDIYNNQDSDALEQGDRVLLLQMLEKTEGGYKVTTAANGVILREEDDFLRRLPYVMCRFETLRKCFWGRGLVIPYIGLQDTINKISGMILDNAKLTANQQKEVDVNKLTETANKNMFNNTPGFVYFMNGTDAIKPVPTQSVPGYVREILDRATNDLMRLTGTTDVMRGESPAGRPTGALVEKLQFMGDRRNRRLLKAQWAAFKEIGEMIVELAFEHYHQTRPFKVTDPATGQPVYFDFNAADYLQLGEDGKPIRNTEGRLVTPEMDIRVIAGNSLPDSPEFKYQQAQKDWELKAIDREEYLKKAGYANYKEIVARIKADEDEERMKSVQMQVYQNQLSIQMKQQSEGAAPATEEGGSPAPSGVDAVADKLNALTPEELAAFAQLPPEQQMQEIQGLADTPLSQQEAAALMQALQPQ